MAKVDMVDKQVQLLGVNTVVGRSMVVHEKKDDLGAFCIINATDNCPTHAGRGVGDAKEESLKTGNAGPRLGCGIIGWASSA